MAFCGNFLKISGCRAFKARLHVKRGGTARVEMSTGSNKICPFIRASFVRERIKEMARSSENRGTNKDRLHVVFFRDQNR